MKLRRAFQTTEATASLLETLRDGESPCDELTALRTGEVRDFVQWEHRTAESEGWHPLLEHAHAAVARYLAGLDEEVDPFDVLDGDRFVELASTFGIVRHYALAPPIRCALVFLDFAKGGSPSQRRAWLADGVDLTVHNHAAAAILAASDLREELDWREAIFDLTLEMIANHGLAGQHVRGETPRGAFSRWVGWLRANLTPLAQALDVTENQAVTLACNAMHVIDVCDTAAVRPGLMDDRLHAELKEIRNLWIAAVDAPELLAETRPLEERFRRLRRQSHERGEPLTRIDGAVAAVGAEQREWLDRLLPNAQLWYFEPATHRLSSEAAMKILFLGLAHADDEERVDASKPFHLSLQPLVEMLGAPTSGAAYRERLVEALLSERSYDELRRGEFPKTLLASFLPRIGGTTAVALDLHTTDEAEALVTLLTIYERRSSVAFHQILKLLCDAYGLRKDEFDRLSNEAQYLETMNAARSDKDRMLHFVTPGTIVEIGPGGGVVLDMLEDRFPDSDVVGLDVSELAVEELRRRKETEGHSWRIVHGDAYELPQIFGTETVDTVVFCSVLHEIYSYVERDGAKFQMASVRRMLEAAYDTLKRGGRIVIRDGVKPPSGTRIIEFIDPDGPDFLRRFIDEFEGRAVAAEWLDESRTKMTTADAMEFLYCYTWGAASFPYEVREQYGIMEREEYEGAVLEWLADHDPPAAAVDVGELSSYLQPGYVRALAEKVRLTDADGSPVDLPDSNAVWVFEKPA